MKEFRHIRDRFVVQDEHTIRAVTAVCAVLMVFSVFVSLFVARQLYDTNDKIRNLEANNTAILKDRSTTSSEFAARTSSQAMAARIKDMQLIPITQTLQLANANLTSVLPVQTPIAEKK